MQMTEAMPIANTGSNSTMAMQHKAEVEAMVDTAKKYPRNLDLVEQKAIAMATADQETATEMIYSLPRGGKNIEGFSTRLTEVVANAWGNIRYGARVLHVGETTITAQGYCFDCENNTGGTVEVERRITDKYNKRFNEDMIVVTGNAACSVALRNAIAKVIPRTFINKVYRLSKEVAIGKATPLTTQRSQVVEFIKKMGITEDRILSAVKRPNIESLAVDDIATLRGLSSAVREGEISADEAFPEVKQPPKKHQTQMEQFTAMRQFCQDKFLPKDAPADRKGLLDTRINHTFAELCEMNGAKPEDVNAIPADAFQTVMAKLRETIAPLSDLPQEDIIIETFPTQAPYTQL